MGVVPWVFVGRKGALSDFNARSLLTFSPNTRLALLEGLAADIEQFVKELLCGSDDASVTAILGAG